MHAPTPSAKSNDLPSTASVPTPRTTGTTSRAYEGSKVHNVLYKGMVIPTAIYAVLVAAIRRRLRALGYLED